MALVREKPLEFKPNGDIGICAECIAGTYVIRPAHDGGYEWWLCLIGCTVKVATLEEAKDACQRDFHQRWLRDTYVPPLVWVDGACSSASGRYVVAQDDTWYAMCGSVEIGSMLESRDAATDFCNHHNRRLVIGE